MGSNGGGKETVLCNGSGAWRRENVMVIALKEIVILMVMMLRCEIM